MITLWKWTFLPDCSAPPFVLSVSRPSLFSPCQRRWMLVTPPPSFPLSELDGVNVLRQDMWLRRVVLQRRSSRRTDYYSAARWWCEIRVGCQQLRGYQGQQAERPHAEWDVSKRKPEKTACSSSCQIIGGARSVMSDGMLVYITGSEGPAQRRPGKSSYLHIQPSRCNFSQFVWRKVKG